MSDATTIALVVIGAQTLATQDTTLALVVCAAIKQASSDRPSVQAATAVSAGHAGNRLCMSSDQIDQLKKQEK